MGAARGTRPVPTFDHLQKKKPLERRVPILIDDAPLEQLNKLLAQDSPDESAVAEARAAVESATVTCVFRSIGRRAYDDLIKEHPPQECENLDCGDCDTCKTREETGDPKARAPYHGPTFAPALVAASCVEPPMTVEQVQALFEEWNTAEVMDLFLPALEVNTQRRVVEMGKG